MTIWVVWLVASGVVENLSKVVEWTIRLAGRLASQVIRACCVMEALVSQQDGEGADWLVIRGKRRRCKRCHRVGRFLG